MEIKLGNFNIVPALEREDLLTPATAKLIPSLPDAQNIGVTEIDPGVSDTAAFCEKYGISPDVTANCVIVETRRGENHQFVACIVLATTRADVNGLVRRTLDARKASFAPMEEAVKQTGMEYGAINPIGLPEGWPIFIDSRIPLLPAVVIGSGLRKSKIILPGSVLASIPNARVLEGLGQLK